MLQMLEEHDGLDLLVHKKKHIFNLYSKKD